MRLPSTPRIRRLWAAAVVVLLLATGGLIAVAAPRTHLAGRPLPDVAVFMRSGGLSGPCGVVVWLHLRYGRPGVDVVVVPPDVLVRTAAGTAVPLHRLVEQSGPQAGARALAGLLGVPLRGWLSLDLDVLLKSIDMGSLAAEVAAGAEDHGRPLTAAEYAHQVTLLRVGVALAPRQDLPVPAFENYVLAAGKATTSLSLNDVAWMAKAMRDAARDDVAVLALPASVRATAAGPRWRAQAAAVLSLVQELRRRPDAPVPAASP